MEKEGGEVRRSHIVRGSPFGRFFVQYDHAYDSIFVEFKEFCRKNTRNSYIEGIKKLLEGYKVNKVQEILEIKEDVELLNERVNDLDDEEQDSGDVIPTMGSCMRKKK